MEVIFSPAIIYLPNQLYISLTMVYICMPSSGQSQGGLLLRVRRVAGQTVYFAGVRARICIIRRGGGGEHSSQTYCMSKKS